MNTKDWYVMDGDKIIPLHNDIEEMLTYMYEVDRGNCLMTNEDWIKELELAMTDPKYKEKFLAEHQEYVKAMNA